MQDGTVTRVNQAFLNLTGHGRADLLAQCRLQDLMTAPSQEFFETPLRPLMRLQGAVKEVACDLQRPGREPLAVQLNGTEVRDATGMVQRDSFHFFRCQ